MRHPRYTDLRVKSRRGLSGLTCNAKAFVYAYFFSDLLRFDMSLLLLTVAMRGVSNKHCLLSLFLLGSKEL